MADTATAPAVSATPAKKTKSAAKKAQAKATHPPTAVMVNAAIQSLKERGGSSLQAIKKFIAANYKLDAEKLAPFIRKYLKSAVTSGTLVQTKGKGASGSFKIAVKGEGNPKAAPAKKAAAVKPKVAKKPKAASSPKKAAVKKVAAKKPAAAKKAVAKTPSKVKKATKLPTKKPKSPKPKKTATKTTKKAAKK